MLDSPSTLQAAINTQAKLATYDLQYILRDSEEWSKALVKAELNNDTGRCQIVVSFPVMAPDEQFSGTRSLMKVNKLHDLISDQMLPMYFGEHLHFNAYDLKEDFLVARFEATDVLRFIENRVIPVDEIAPVRIDENLMWQAHEISRAIDFMVATSKLNSTYRLPFGHRIFDRYRLRESIYGIDHYKVGEGRTMIRLCCMATCFFRESNMESINALVYSLERFLQREKNVIDFKIGECGTWRGKRYLEVRVII